ncbi:MAG: hypothetical protein H0X31_24165 [Nostocaceae cyanobacterium]|nr:hypothetical protein [Nostocaceae cyanobacterium]
MTDEELKQLIESNARKAQAMSDNTARSRQERHVVRVGMIKFQNVMERLMKVEEAIEHLLVSRGLR